MEARRANYRFFALFFEGRKTAGLRASWPAVFENIRLLGEAFGADEKLPGRPFVPLAADDALEVEFAKVFYGVGDTTVPLVESAYTDEDHLVNRKSAMAARDFYARFGFGLREEDDWRADHISVELQFMDMLLAEESGEEGDSAAKEFFEGHLCLFAKQFVNRAAVHADAELLMPVLESFALFVLTEERIFREG